MGQRFVLHAFYQLMLAVGPTDMYGLDVYIYWGPKVGSTAAQVNIDESNQRTDCSR